MVIVLGSEQNHKRRKKMKEKNKKNENPSPLFVDNSSDFSDLVLTLIWILIIIGAILFIFNLVESQSGGYLGP